MPVGFSEVAIYNLALDHIGSKATVEDKDESNNPAKTCKRWYPVARLATLEVFNWGFARKSQALALHSVAAPSYRWTYRYQWPSDCIAPRYLENPAGVNADAVPFETEEADDDTQSIVTDLESATLIYTRDLTDVTRFSMHFTMMLALQLALFINSPLAGKVSRRDRIQQEYQTMLVNAPVFDASGSVPRDERSPSWIQARS